MCGATVVEPLTTRDAVARDTPARCATFSSVGRSRPDNTIHQSSTTKGGEAGRLAALHTSHTVTTRERAANTPSGERSQAWLKPAPRVPQSQERALLIGAPFTAFSVKRGTLLPRGLTGEATGATLITRL